MESQKVRVFDLMEDHCLAVKIVRQIYRRNDSRSDINEVLKIWEQVSESWDMEFAEECFVSLFERIWWSRAVDKAKQLCACAVRADGMYTVKTGSFLQEMKTADIIFNTIPERILSAKQLVVCEKEECMDFGYYPEMAEGLRLHRKMGVQVGETSGASGKICTVYFKPGLLRIRFFKNWESLLLNRRRRRRHIWGIGPENDSYYEWLLCTYENAFQELQKLVEAGAKVQTLFQRRLRRLTVGLEKVRKALCEEWDSDRKNTNAYNWYGADWAQKVLIFLIVLPCTGKYDCKTCNGITDYAGIDGGKGASSKRKPLLLSISTNDALGMKYWKISVWFGMRNIVILCCLGRIIRKEAKLMIAHTELLRSGEAALTGNSTSRSSSLRLEMLWKLRNSGHFTYFVLGKMKESDIMKYIWKRGNTMAKIWQKGNLLKLISFSYVSGFMEIYFRIFIIL